MMKLRIPINVGKFDTDLMLIINSGYSLPFLITLALESHLKGKEKVFFLDDLISINLLDFKKIKREIKHIYFSNEKDRQIYRYFCGIDRNYISFVTKSLLRLYIVNLLPAMSWSEGWVEIETNLMLNRYAEKDIIHIKASDTRDNAKKKALLERVLAEQSNESSATKNDDKPQVVKTEEVSNEIIKEEPKEISKEMPKEEPAEVKKEPEATEESELDIDDTMFNLLNR